MLRTIAIVLRCGELERAFSDNQVRPPYLAGQPLLASQRVNISNNNFDFSATTRQLSIARDGHKDIEKSDVYFHLCAVDCDEGMRRPIQSRQQ